MSVEMEVYMNYTIKYVCENLNLTVHTVRYYCDQQLVPNLRHDKNGNRIFDDESINWLKAAKFLRSSGLSIPEIRHYFSLCQQGISTIEERREILIRLRAQAQKDLEDAQERVDCLSDKITLCEKVMDGTSGDDCNPLNW